MCLRSFSFPFFLVVDGFILIICFVFLFLFFEICVLSPVERVEQFPSVSLTSLEGMEKMTRGGESSSASQNSQLKSLLKTCTGWQKPSATLKGRCVLISYSRFEVDIGYAANIVGVFKQVNSRIYGD